MNTLTRIACAGIDVASPDSADSVCAAQRLMRPPSASTFSWSRLGRPRHRPPTSNRSLISWTVPFILELAVPGDATLEIPQRRDKSSSEFQSRFLLHQPVQAAPDDGKGQCLGTRSSQTRTTQTKDFPVFPEAPEPPFPPRLLAHIIFFAWGLPG